MLILFDIDATLLTTRGVGVQSMKDAGQELFGPAFRTDHLDFAGRLDPLIIDDLFRVNHVTPSPPRLQCFRVAYRRRLAARLSSADAARTLPGVPQLLTALAQRPGTTLGLLTGNFEETGRLKLDACGLNPEQFAVRVWGDEAPGPAPTRDDLPPVAFRKYQEIHGRAAEPNLVTIIGDTPHDVLCALVNGCRSIAVATGKYDRGQLAQAGAHLVVDSLADTPSILSWIDA